MQVFRLCKACWASSAFSGEGALRYAGRWHFPGHAVVYTSSSRALAALEVLVHLEIRHAPPTFVLIPAHIPEDLISQPEDLPEGWDSVPAGDASRTVGTGWLQSARSTVLRVPSIVVPGEHNFLFNPSHPDFGQIQIGKPEPFAFDPRLI